MAKKNKKAEKVNKQKAKFDSLEAEIDSSSFKPAQKILLKKIAGIL